MTDVVLGWMTDEELIAAEISARRKAHGCPVYTGDVVATAVRSSMRACAVADEWMTTMRELKKRGLSPGVSIQ